MVDKLDILDKVKKLGLNDDEAAVYLELVGHQNISVLELSKCVGIPRSTTYRICKNLVEKRFATWVVPKRGAKIAAIAPGKLGFVIDDMSTELKETILAYEQLTTLIPALSTTVPHTQVKYYEGVSGMKQIIWNSLDAKDEIFGYSVYGRRDVVGEKWTQKFVEEFRVRKLRDRVITNETNLDYIRKYFDPVNHHQEVEDIRLIESQQFYVSGDITIYNDIYAVSFWKHGEVVGVEIQNPEIVRHQRSVFELLWPLAKPLSNFL